MALDNAEKFTLAFQSLGIGQKVFASISDLGPSPHKAIDFAPIIGVKAGILHGILVEIDDPVHDAKDLIPLLGLSEDGNLANILNLVSDTLRDIAD